MINRNFDVELFEEDGKQKVYISTNGASGAKYELNSLDDVGEFVTDYVKDYQNE